MLQNGGADQFVTDISINRDLGPDERDVMRQLMNHLGINNHLNVKETPDDRAPEQGEWVHLRARDTAAAAGRARLYLASQSEVDWVFAALHGQVLAVGADRIGITITNDLNDQPKAGNGRRVAGAAARHP